MSFGCVAAAGTGPEAQWRFGAKSTIQTEMIKNKYI
jgi:hypothetical protein